MTNLNNVVRQLRKERKGVQGQLERLDQAISTLQGLSKGSRSARGGSRHMSAAARRRIAAAQKARWAKWHEQHDQMGKTNRRTTPKRVVSIASRRKMAAAQRARRANTKKAA
jgi:hypothetical protein